jgi:predicted HTH domain antitoxin
VTLTFQVPDSILQEVHLPLASAQAAVMKEVVLALYARGLLSLGRASEFSGLTRPEFESLLAQRHVERPYDTAELERELAWAKGAK